MRKCIIYVVLFLFVFYSIFCQAECFGSVNTCNDSKQGHRIVEKSNDVEQNLDSKVHILHEIIELDEQENYFCYIVCKKIRPFVPVKYKNVVVKTKFRPQAARMSVDEGASFIFA